MGRESSKRPTSWAASCGPHAEATNHTLSHILSPCTREIFLPAINYVISTGESLTRGTVPLVGRWSAIAAKLPGRTDNEIKNVWHTHLKKRFVGPNMSSSGSSKRKTTGCSRTDRTVLSQPLSTQLEADHRGARLASMSPEQSYSDLYSFATDWSGASGGISNVKEEGCSSQELQEIDEGFWLETLSTDEPATLTIPTTTPPPPTNDRFDLFTSSDMDDTDFWLNVFMGAGDLQELTQL